MYDRLIGNHHYSYRTRFSRHNRAGPRFEAEHQLGNRSFQWRATNQWNMLPQEVQNIENLQKFKQSLKTWIKLNIQL